MKTSTIKLFVLYHSISQHSCSSGWSRWCTINLSPLLHLKNQHQPLLHNKFFMSLQVLSCYLLRICRVWGVSCFSPPCSILTYSHEGTCHVISESSWRRFRCVFFARVCQGIFMFSLKQSNSFNRKMIFWYSNHQLSLRYSNHRWVSGIQTINWVSGIQTIDEFQVFKPLIEFQVFKP